MDSTLRLDSSIASRHRIYSLSVPSGALPLVSHTDCHLITLTPEVHILLYQTLGLTLYSCLYFRSTLQLLRYAPFLQDFVIMNFQIFPVDSCTLLNHDSLNSSNKYSSTPPLRLWFVCVLCVLYYDCSWLPLWAGLGGSCFCNFKSFTSSTSTLRLIDSSTHQTLYVCVSLFFWLPLGVGMWDGNFCKSFISVSGLHIDSSTLRLFEHFKLFMFV